jgi:hypothetical protein
LTIKATANFTFRPASAQDAARISEDARHTQFQHGNPPLRQQGPDAMDRS